MVGQILGVVVKLMADSNDQVRLTAVWVLGRICSEIPEAVDASGSADGGRSVLGPLVTALNGSPLMAEKACWCIASLCGHGSSWMYSGQNGKQMISELLSRVAKRDVTGSLVLTIHEALNTAICSAPNTDTQLMTLLGQQLLPELAQQLFGVVEGMKRGDRGSDVMQYRMGGLFSTIQVVLHKVRDSAPSEASLVRSHSRYICTEMV